MVKRWAVGLAISRPLLSRPPAQGAGARGVPLWSGLDINDMSFVFEQVASVRAGATRPVVRPRRLQLSCRLRAHINGIMS